MADYFLSTLLRRKERAALLVLGLLLVSAAYLIFIATAETARLTADQNLSRYWRTTYDILVRPAGSRTPIEAKHNLVEANYTSNITGGISFTQLEAIKQIPDIEVAAPIAMLGYHSLAVPSWTPLPDETAIAIREIITVNNGMYPIVEERVPSSALLKPGTAYLSTVVVPIIFAAIDPEQEAKLVGLDAAVVQGRYLSPSDRVTEVMEADWWAGVGITDTGNMPPSLLSRKLSVLPVLLNTHVYVDVEGRVEVYRLTSGGEDLLSVEKLAPYEQVLNDLLHRTGVARTLPVTPILLLPPPSPVHYREISPPFSTGYDLVLEAVPIGTILTQSAVQTFQDSYGKSVIKGIEPLFRAFFFKSVEEISPDKRFKPGTTITVQGVFDIEKLQHLIGDPNQVPLETYFPPLAILKYDEEGDPVEPKALRPTLSVHGYILPPPMMLTTLDAAPLLKGEAAISAIRIRVQGINRLDHTAQEKIEAVASEIYRRTGLEVDIMVGSSPRRILVHVPGDGAAPPIGYVEEYWVQKGVHTLIGRGISKTNLFLFSVFLSVSALFILNTVLITTLQQQREIGLLKAVGWRSRLIFGVVMGEALLVGLLGGLLGGGLALVLARLLALRVPWTQIALAAPLSLALCLVGSFVPVWWAVHRSPIAALQMGEVRPGGGRVGALLPLGYAARSVLRRPWRSLILMVSQAVSSGLVVLILLALYATNGYLSGTLLGEYIQQRIEGYHYLVAVLSFVLAALGLGDQMLLAVREQGPEIGLLKALGWRSRAVFRLFLAQAGWLGLSGGALGVLLAGVIFWGFYRQLPSALLWIGAEGVALSVAVSLLAAWYPAHRAAGLPPAAVMRYG
jgi:cell division protein FtsX